jgi:hypothetical protein
LQPRTREILERHGLLIELVGVPVTALVAVPGLP